MNVWHDSRLMNALANTLLGATLLAVLASAAWWLSQRPYFTLRGVAIEAAEGHPLHHVSAPLLRAAVTRHVRGNFFAVDLDAVRVTFETVPWVRRASVRRVWPDRLVVRIEEHRAAALWQGDERDDRLVNSQGEVFTANVGDVEDEALPAFSGPAGQSSTMLALYRALLPVLRAQDMDVEQLALSTRGSWRVLLDSGATLELGRGTEAEVLARTQRFVRTLPQVFERWRAPLEYADLRHADGYAVRLRGVTTTVTAPKPTL